MADFRDAAGHRSGGWDYSAFVRTYARYLDERLEYKMIGRRQKPRGGMPGEWKMAKAEEEVDEVDEGGEEARSTPLREMPNDRVFARAQHLQVLLDRFLASRPTGAAKTNRIVAMALYPMVKESFQIYFDLTEITATLVDRFMELPVSESVRVHELFCKLSKQLEELDFFYSWSRSAGVSRASDYPEIEHITQKRLDVMDDFIRERSVLPGSHAAGDGAPTVELKNPADDMDTVKALPAPPPPIEVAKKENDEELQEEKELTSSTLVLVAEQVQPKAAEEEVDFLNLRVDELTTEQHEDSLALVLFDGATTSALEVQPWKAFRKTEDWEKALVESASNLAGQKPALGGGLDMLMLDGMYAQQQAVAREGADGSASSMAVIGPTHSVTLALPGPPGQGGGAKEDPFAPSAVVPPPSWVQMSDMEKKQHRLVEEQILWQQYARDGMQGKLPSFYSVGGYTHRL
ncbi:hypothetical protein HPP92_011415 [Vanilla planifolia]|uniref:ENTH domain-containing protein n=1 Tax=Vanilla planifolia TaxID=51239 RepID=A0A835R5M9_VANPL|nr:hypothetical protein HPP92_011415 [Vanilla planifolia]